MPGRVGSLYIRKYSQKGISISPAWFKPPPEFSRSHPRDFKPYTRRKDWQEGISWMINPWKVMARQPVKFYNRNSFCARIHQTPNVISSRKQINSTWFFYLIRQWNPLFTACPYYLWTWPLIFLDRFKKPEVYFPPGWILV